MWSCDLIPTEGNPERHLQMPAETLLDEGWDMLIAFPPCTDLAKSGARWWPEKAADGRQQASARFFIQLAEANISKVAVENPVGFMNTNYRKADQIIQPYWFGDPWKKETCLWLKGLPPLKPTNIVNPEGYWVGGDAKKYGKNRNPKERSRTFKGIAEAMAEQWGK